LSALLITEITTNNGLNDLNHPNDLNDLNHLNDLNLKKMNIFDSHCHLDDKSYAKDLEAVIERARNSGVTRMMSIGIDRRTSVQAVSLAQTREGVYASVGVHPHDVKNCSDSTLRDLMDLAKNQKVRAWGEIGLDFNRMYSPQKDQEKWFERQLEIAVRLDFPLIFHERDSSGRFLEILKNQGQAHINGVVHCFSGNQHELDQYLALGLHIGITGIVTLESRGVQLRQLVPGIPADRLLVETDAPYLVPAPEKNSIRRNEPAFVKSVLLKLAEVRNEDPEELAKKVWENTCRLYRIRA
jgi:TatD DNase family protein